MITWKTLPIVTFGTALITFGSVSAQAIEIVPETTLLRYSITGEFEDGGTISEDSYFDLATFGDGFYNLVNWEITTITGSVIDGTDYTGDIFSQGFDELNFGSADTLGGFGFIDLVEEVLTEDTVLVHQMFVDFEFDSDNTTSGFLDEFNLTFSELTEPEVEQFRVGEVTINPLGQVTFADLNLTENNPILPDLEEDGILTFINGRSGRWYDPILADGFTYEMLGDSLFTGIIGFPAGIGDADGFFTVSVGDKILGEFEVGDTVDFVSQLGDGVSSFTITGIDLTVDAENPNTFPLQLIFDTDTADFQMTTNVVPEPLTILGAGTALGFGGLFKWELGKKKKKKKSIS